MSSAVTAQLRTELTLGFRQGEQLLVSLGIPLGVLVFFFPEAGLVAMTWLIGAYALVFGFLMILLAFRLRRLRPVVGEGVTR